MAIATRSVRIESNRTGSNRTCIPRKFVDNFDRVEETIASLRREPTGSLTIAAPVMFGMHVPAPAIDAFKTRHPATVPKVTIVDRHVDLVSEGSTHPG